VPPNATGQAPQLAHGATLLDARVIPDAALIVAPQGSAEPGLVRHRRSMHDSVVDISGTAALVLARRSSRRQFLRFLSAGSLGAGLWLMRTNVSLGAVTRCAGCGGGPCNPCYSACPICDDLDPSHPCQPCHLAGGCPHECSTFGEWFCCRTGTVCLQRCSECTCPDGCCHCFTNINIPCTPTRHSGDQPCRCPQLEEAAVAPVYFAQTRSSRP
jgi:hypothetical protein